MFWTGSIIPLGEKDKRLGERKRGRERRSERYQYVGRERKRERKKKIAR